MQNIWKLERKSIYQAEAGDEKAARGNLSSAIESTLVKAFSTSINDMMREIEEKMRNERNSRQKPPGKIER